MEALPCLGAAGRPPCPLCDEPLDPAGHLCVRTNGYRRGVVPGDEDVLGNDLDP